MVHLKGRREENNISGFPEINVRSAQRELSQDMAAYTVHYAAQKHEYLAPEPNQSIAGPQHQLGNTES